MGCPCKNKSNAVKAPKQITKNTNGTDKKIIKRTAK